MEICKSYLLDHCKRARFLRMVHEYDSLVAAFPREPDRLSRTPPRILICSQPQTHSLPAPTEIPTFEEINMTISQEIIRPSHSDSGPPAGRRRAKKMVAVSLAFLVCCVAVGPTGCTNGLQNKNVSFGPSGAQVAAAAIGVGAAVVVTVVLVNHHSHHTVKGCVSSGQDGLQVQTQGDMKIYALAGNTANIKVGDLVKFHGTKVRKVKDSAGNRTFTVEKISRDYGPCKLNSEQPANALNAR